MKFKRKNLTPTTYHTLKHPNAMSSDPPNEMFPMGLFSSWPHYFVPTDKGSSLFKLKGDGYIFHSLGTFFGGNQSTFACIANTNSMLF